MTGRADGIVGAAPDRAAVGRFPPDLAQAPLLRWPTTLDDRTMRRVADAAVSMRVAPQVPDPRCLSGASVRTLWWGSHQAEGVGTIVSKAYAGRRDSLEPTGQRMLWRDECEVFAPGGRGTRAGASS